MFESGALVIITDPDSRWGGLTGHVGASWLEPDGRHYAVTMRGDGLQIAVREDRMKPYSDITGAATETGRTIYGTLPADMSSDSVVELVRLFPTVVTGYDVASAKKGDDWGARWYPWWDNFLDVMRETMKRRGVL